MKLVEKCYKEAGTVRVVVKDVFGYEVVANEQSMKLRRRNRYVHWMEIIGNLSRISRRKTVQGTILFDD